MLLVLVTTAVLAQVVLEERFEQPLGGAWTVPGPNAAVSGAETTSAAHWGALGMELEKHDGGTHFPSLANDFVPAADPSPMHFRVWFRVLEGPTTLRVTPLQVGHPIDAFTLGELYLDPAGSQQLYLSCADADFRELLIPRVVQPGEWVLLELDLDGFGTADGGCRGAVNGVEASMAGFAWSARGSQLLVTGFNVVDDGWQGRYAIDDLLITRDLPAMAMALRTADAGACTGLHVDFLARDGGPAPAPSTARFVARIDGGALFTDPQCSSALPVGSELDAAQLGALFFSIEAPAAQLDVTANDVLPARVTVPRAARGDPRPLAVGCGCGSGPLAPVGLALAWALLRLAAHNPRRRIIARTVPPG